MNITGNYYYHLKKMKYNLIIKSNIDSGDIDTGDTGVLQYAPIQFAPNKKKNKIK
jgi:hypothetical protein